MLWSNRRQNIALIRVWFDHRILCNIMHAYSSTSIFLCIFCESKIQTTIFQLLYCNTNIPQSSTFAILNQATLQNVFMCGYHIFTSLNDHFNWWMCEFEVMSSKSKSDCRPSFLAVWLAVGLVWMIIYLLGFDWKKRDWFRRYVSVKKAFVKEIKVSCFDLLCILYQSCDDITFSLVTLEALSPTKSLPCFAA